MPDQRILVYRLGSLGDTIIALPAFHAVRRAFPEGKIVLLTNRPVSNKAAAVESILGRGHFFDDVLDYPTGTRNPLVLAALVTKIRLRKVDTAINLAAYRSDAATRRDRIFFQLAGVRKFHGFDLVKADKQPFRDPLTGETEPEARRIARRVKDLCLIDLDDPRSWDLHLDARETGEAQKAISPLGERKTTIALAIGTKVQAKHWGVNNWRELCRRLSSRLENAAAVFLGAREEFSEAEECLKAWSGPALNLCGATSPRVSAGVLSQCGLFIGHDSGPMHLAASVGVPCVAVFSARNLPRQWFPHGRIHRVLYHETECAGCGLEVCIEKQKHCILSIRVEEVFDAAVGVLANRQPPP
jgi:ADP-heptose:LPS heptosyltransferase